MDEINKSNTLPGVMRKCFKLGLFKIIPSLGSKEKTKNAAVSENESDIVSKAIGDCGRWQFLNIFLLSLFSFPCTFHIYLPTFTAKETKFWCRRPDNFSTLPVSEWINYSQPTDACSVRLIPPGVTVESILNHTAPLLNTLQKCTEWEFDKSEVGETIISEWELVCDRANITNLAEVVFLIGVGIGGVAGGFISDKFGRKRILMSMLIAQCILAILSLLVKSYLQYILVRLVMGLVSVSVVYAAFVLAVELVAGKWVTIAGVCIFFPLPISYIFVSIMSLILPNWRDLQLSVSLPGCLLVLLWFVIPESPRWLLSMGKNQEAKAVLQKAANFNKKELPNDFDKLLTIQNTDTKSEKTSVGILFKPPILKRTICLSLAWFATTIAYYSIVLNIGNMKLGNLHLTSIILAIVEIPAIGISIPILLNAGRRFPIFSTMIICGAACVLTEIFIAIFKYDWLVIVSLTVGKFAISATNMMLPIYTAELYPTVVRNLGVGGSQLSAGIALMCIPYLWRLETVNDHLPMVTIAILSIIGGSIVLILPETADINKSETKALDRKASLSTSTNGTFTFTRDDRGQ